MPCPIDTPARWPLWLAGAALLAGCAQPVQPPPPGPAAAPNPTQAPPTPAPVAVVAPALPAVPPEDLAARQLLAFHERLRTLSAADLAREQARLANPAGTAETLEAALLLGHGRQPGDLTRALALLDPLVRESSPAAPLARLLQSRLAEQRRLEEQAERQAQQLRDQQRRLDQLSQQLDALRAIERSLGTRPPPASAPRTP